MLLAEKAVPDVTGEGRLGGGLRKPLSHSCGKRPLNKLRPEMAVGCVQEPFASYWSIEFEAKVHLTWEWLWAGL